MWRCRIPSKFSKQWIPDQKKGKRERHKLNMLEIRLGNTKENCSEPIFSFSKSVLGDLHKLKNRPCEDNSASYSEENGKYHIAVVADGHGSAECFRSKLGSQIAAEVAVEFLQSFAKDFIKRFDAMLQSKETTSETASKPEKELEDFHDGFFEPKIRPLTDTIIAEWNDRVEADYETNPPTKEELGKAGLSEGAIFDPHFYGTTLIAALWLPECLIIIHQGDGRCVVFYNDGTMDQPVPWDERCIGTAVTSMCDNDAITHIRHKILDFRKKKAIACYLGSDGVEDAYRDTYDEKGLYCMGNMGGVYAFYKNLTCQIIEKGQNQIDNYLEEMLPIFSAEGLFSRTGSGDDVSVAGIVDVEAVKKFNVQFERDIKVYDLKEQLFWKEDELRGKMRKHGILLKRMNEAQEEITKTKAAIDKIAKEEDLCLKEQSKLENDIQRITIELQEFERDCAESEVDLNDGKFDKILRTIGLDRLTANHNRDKERNSLQARYHEIIEKQSKCSDELEKLRQKNDSAVNSLHQIEKKHSEAKEKFEEYDANYKRIEKECLLIKEEIDKVLKQNEDKALTN